MNKLARPFKIDKDELIVLWLADKLKEVIDDEPLASKTLELIEKENK